MRKRIAINGLSIISRPSGGRTYILNLVEEMIKVGQQDYVFYLLISKPVANLFERSISGANTHLVTFPSIVQNALIRICIEQFFLPVWLLWKRIDLLFASRNVMPILAPCRTVIGVHSMHLNYEQENLPFWRRVYGSVILKISAKRADAYLAISQYAGDTYVKKYRLPRGRLFVAPNGFKRNLTSFKYIKQNPVGSEYLLFVSTLFPHKNVDFLIRVFAEVSKARPSVKLVIVGRSVGGTMTALKRLSQQLSLSEKVYFTGEITDNELMQLYANTRVFVFPSLREGFGLAPLEAMAHSIPVIVSNRTSIPEVVGDAGIVLSPEDKGLWAQNILKLMEDDILHQELSKRAGDRSKLFTWRCTAEIAIDSFRAVLDPFTKITL
jgi:glycosyltransferase involved in cell wall biosynthesis